MHPVCELCGARRPAGQARCPSCGAGGGASGPRCLPAGTRLQGGRFTLGRVLGRGGFGITYKGAHMQLRRPVAVKELFPEFAVRTGRTVTVPADRREGFRREREGVVREARALAGLEGPGIVGVHDCFDENGTVYIVLEYLEGPTLEAEIARRGRLPPADAVRVAAQVCEALGTVHGAGLLHRDVKPANILLARDGRAVLLDFGSARAYEGGKTQRHTVVVTPDYAAPEQFGAEGRFGPCTDLFGLGATLHHALTGAPPPPALTRLLEPDPAVSLPASVPQGLRLAVEAALHCRVEARPQTAAAFTALLNGAEPRPAPSAAPRGGRPSAGSGGADPDARDDEGETSLHRAALFGEADAARALLDAGADVNARDDDGDTPLHRAIRNGHVKVARALLDAGADADARSKDDATPLYLAILNGHVKFARALLDAGADADARGYNGNTPLCLAIRDGHVKFARALLDAGADANARDDDGDTPLHWAAGKGHVEVVRALLDAGADANARGDDGDTPLRLAAGKGHVEVVRALLDAGADANARGDDGDTPLHRAPR